MEESVKSSLSFVKQPVKKARGLPNVSYICKDWFKEEKKTIFFDRWFAVSSVHIVPEIGSVYPMEFLGLPLLITRDQKNVIHVFQNVCRHRGMILVDKPMKTNGVVRCPYHSWCYTLAGDLRVTPHVGGPGNNIHEDIHKEELGLFEFRCHEYMGVIFINVSGDAPDFEEYIQPLHERWREFDHSLFHGGVDSYFMLDVNCNWKLAVENYCESYHLPWVHPGLNSYSRLEDHYDIIDNEHKKFSGQGTYVYQPTVGKDGRCFDCFHNLSEKWNKSAEYIALYPNVLIGVHRDHVFNIVLQPISENKTYESVNIYYTSEAMLLESWKEKREANSALWKGIFEEDIFVVEGMQKGRYANQFDGGKFSPAMDCATHCFHHWIADNI